MNNQTQQDQVLEPEDIQGLVLLGYGHLAFGAYVFFEINDPQGAKSWLGQALAEGRISHAGKWQDGVKPDHAMNLGFTYVGVERLLGDSARIDNFPLEYREGMAFRERAESVLGDTDESAPENWDFGGAKADHNANREHMDGILIILASSAEQRDSLVTEYTADMQAHGMRVIYTQVAAKLPHDREHFGFLDGISQPAVEGSHREPKPGDPKIKAGEFVLGYRNEYQMFPELPTLNRDYRFGRNGTYLVVRKLRQDVAKFWNFVADYAQNGDAVPPVGMSNTDKMTWLASKFVGRFPNGTPLVYESETQTDTPKENLNTFYYAGGKEGKNPRDPNGLKCPFSAHIRRMNPRDSQGPTPEASLTVSDRHMIIRRGMSYGDPLFEDMLSLPTDSVQDDEQERGLMFLCINANISRQFEFIQQTWANNTKFHGMYQDRDPLIGNHELTDDSETTSSFVIPRKPIRQRVLNIPRFVTMRGGGYFFMPSLTALQMMVDHTDE